MAKTQSDYEAEGAQLFLSASVRPEGNSWQAKARQKGFDNAQIQSEGKAVAMGLIDKSLTDEIVNMKTECKDFEFAGLVTPGEQFIPIHMNTWMHGRKTAEHHIAILHSEIAQSTTMNRRERLRHKIFKLERKWNLEINKSISA